MNFFRSFQVTAATLFLAVGLYAQDAQELIAAASKVYADAGAYVGELDSRTVSLGFPDPDAEKADGDAAYRVLGVRYQRIQLKIRKPSDYLLGVQNFRAGPASARPGGESWMFLARKDGDRPKHGAFTGGNFTVKDISIDQFYTTARVTIGAFVTEDLVLKNFELTRTAVADVPSFGLKEPDLLGRESINNRWAFRLVAKNAQDHPVMLWIDQETFTIVRTIVQRPRANRSVSVVETLYKNQQLRPFFSAGDFAIDAPDSTSKPTAAEMGFIDVAELVKLAQVAPGDGTGSDAAEEEADEVADAKPVETKPAEVGAQALSYEQMAGIVLIEGDKGTGTGFMTKIRGIDFVVTNLHVLGRNKKFTLKTLNGAEIQPQSVFGAVGGDVAIIRIGAGEGALKLSEDVFKNAKIGDKVVVVGNRLGGGVATQTPGSIVGVGPTRVEVSANFEPGNSGSPIVNLSTGEVVGVATYSSTRRIEIEEGRRAPSRSSEQPEREPKIEKRWFGFRIDGVSKWEGIDLGLWTAQAERIDNFRQLSEALHAVIKLDFATARQHPRLVNILTNFDSKYRAAGRNSLAAATEVKDLFRVIRTISDDGVRDLTHGNYYDYYRTCMYWEDSIPAQLEYRKDIVEVLKKYEANSNLYLSRMRGN